MSKQEEIHNLQQIKHALSFLDLKGTNETVTMAMQIVSVAEGFVRRGQPFDAPLLLRYARCTPLEAST